MWDQEQWFDRAHNQFIDWFISGGFPAGVLYITLYLLSVWAIIRSDKLSIAEQAVLLGLFAGFAFNNLFVFDNLISAIYFWVLVAFAHGLVRHGLPKHLALTRPLSDHAVAIAAPIIGVVVLGAGWWLNVPGLVRAQTVVNGISPNNPQALTELGQALGSEGWPGGNQLGVQEVAEQIAQFASALNGSSQSPETVAQANALAADALQIILAQRPHDARLELFKGTFLASTGQRQASIDALKGALADSPTKQQILFQLAITSLNTGDATGALGYLKTAFDEAPDYGLARVLYASGFYYTGQNAAADALLIEGFGSTIADNTQLLQVYTDTKQWARAEAIWQLRITNNPHNASNYLGLAQVYFASGDKANTIAALQKISQIDPSQAVQMQQLITQIQNGTLKPPGQ